jgi:hypothetical protein
MRNNPGKAALLAAAVALVVLLTWGIEQAAIAPLQTGDVYPPYSSLRADPLGAKALYESLAALPDLTVERLYKQRTALEARDTIFVLGIEPVAWSAVPRQTLEEYEKLVAAGGRMVIAFLPVHPARTIPEKREVEERWNLKLHYRGDRFESSDERSGIPRESALYFEAGPEWRPIPEHTAVERTFGKGSVVLVADTFPLSNEGLRDAHDAKLVAALAGPATRIIFDENHFGVVETGSVTKLMHKYRLEGAIAMSALAAALFLWRSASSFLPPRLAIAKDAVTGRDALHGMTALLYHGVPEKELLAACFGEWSKSTPRESRATRIEEEIRRFPNDPVQAYRAASKILTENK